VRNRKIGFVFQSFNLLPRLSAVEQVELPLAYARVPHRRRLAIAALESVGLGDRIDHRPTELSGGQQQRVAIARALVTRPSMILADEPTGNLDTRSSEEIMALFEDLNRQGITVVFVTHEADIAAHTRRVLHIRDGLLTSDERRARAAAPPPSPPGPLSRGCGRGGAGGEGVQGVRERRPSRNGASGADEPAAEQRRMEGQR